MSTQQPWDTNEALKQYLFKGSKRLNLNRPGGGDPFSQGWGAQTPQSSPINPEAMPGQPLPTPAAPNPPPSEEEPAPEPEPTPEPQPALEPPAQPPPQAAGAEAAPLRPPPVAPTMAESSYDPATVEELIGSEQYKSLLTEANKNLSPGQLMGLTAVFAQRPNAALALMSHFDRGKVAAQQTLAGLTANTAAFNRSMAAQTEMNRRAEYAAQARFDQAMATQNAHLIQQKFREADELGVGNMPPVDFDYRDTDATQRWSVEASRVIAKGKRIEDITTDVTETILQGIKLGTTNTAQVEQMFMDTLRSYNQGGVNLFPEEEIQRLWKSRGQWLVNASQAVEQDRQVARDWKAAQTKHLEALSQKAYFDIVEDMRTDAAAVDTRRINDLYRAKNSLEGIRARVQADILNYSAMAAGTKNDELRKVIEASLPDMIRAAADMDADIALLREKTMELSGRMPSEVQLQSWSMGIRGLAADLMENGLISPQEVAIRGGGERGLVKATYAWMKEQLAAGMDEHGRVDPSQVNIKVVNFLNAQQAIWEGMTSEEKADVAVYFQGVEKFWESQ